MFPYLLFHTLTLTFSSEALTLLSNILRFLGKDWLSCVWLPPAGFRSYPLTNTINNQKTISYKAISNTSKYIFYDHQDNLIHGLIGYDMIIKDWFIFSTFRLHIKVCIISLATSVLNCSANTFTVKVREARKRQEALPQGSHALPEPERDRESDQHASISASVLWD